MKSFSLAVAASAILSMTGLSSATTDVGPEHRRLTDRTFFFCEIPLQTAYSNGNIWPGWFGRWTDMPLTIDRSLGFPGEWCYGVTWPDLLITLREMAEGGIDAATFNVGKFHLAQMVGDAGLRGEKTPAGLVPDWPPLTPFDMKNGPKEDEPYFRPAFYNPNGVFFLNKPLVNCYYVGRMPREALKKKLDGIRSRWGDFWLLPYGDAGFSPCAWRKIVLDGGEPSAEQVAEAKEKIREQLRIADGLYFYRYNDFTKLEEDECCFDADFTRRYPLRFYREIFAEPEFCGKKLFGMVSGMGHCNSYAVGNSVSSNGSRTLRDSLSLAFETNPDVITFFEWDEWNENTGIRPTLCNSFAPRRIVRAMRAAYEGRPNDPLPGDDLVVPNLILSLRKTLALGETAQFELLNVPDSAAKGRIQATLSLKDENGRLLKEFPSVSFDATKLGEHRFKCCSGDFGDVCALVPELNVKSASGTRQWTDGLPFTEIRATANWDHKWALMPLRDLIAGGACRVVPAGRVDGKERVALFGTAPEGIDRLELTDGGDVVYSMSGNPVEEFREDKSNYVFMVMNTAYAYLDKRPILSLSGVSDAEWLVATNRTRGISRAFKSQAEFTPNTYVKVPKSEARSAVLKLDWPENGTYEIPLAKVLDSGVYSVTGTNSLGFTVHRCLRQPAFFAAVGSEDARTGVEIVPDLPVSVIGGHVITAKGRLFRSKPIVIGKRSGKRVPVRFWSSFHQEVRTVDVAAERVPDLVYDVSGTRTGVVCPSGHGWAFNGILGGFTAAATRRNRGGDSRQHCCLYDARRWRNPSCAPEQVVEDGIPTLRFDGSGTYFVLPGGVIPRTTAFRLSFDFRVDDLGGCEREIFSCGLPELWGTVGYIKVMPDRSLRAIGLSVHEYGDACLRSPESVREGWNHVELVSLCDSMELVLNGESLGRVVVLPPGRFDANCWFGGRKDRLFKGAVRNVKVKHGSF